MAHTAETLLEQLQINDIAIARRKALLDFTDADVRLLLSCKGLVTEYIDSIVADFYEKQLAVDEIALLIGDADTLARLHKAQRAYILTLFEGFYDREYVNNRLRIGMVHKRIGVDPRLYLSAVKVMKDTINMVLDLHTEDKKHLLAVSNALDKLLYFDVTFVFETYIRGMTMEVEAAKDKVMNYAKELEQRVAERTQQLLELSLRDTLTGLYNRRALDDYLRRELLIAKRHSRIFSLAYFDLDDFKLINDTDGHFAGDEILRFAGEAMQAACRDIDFPCRVGGDEFCLALPDCTLADAQNICQRMIDLFAQRTGRATMSIGIVQTGPTEFFNADDLLRAADSKMYEAKTQKGFKICV